jgi:hypothetical protein
MSKIDSKLTKKLNKAYKKDKNDKEKLSPFGEEYYSLSSRLKKKLSNKIY